MLHESVAKYVETRFSFRDEHLLATEDAIYEHIKQRFGTQPVLTSDRQRCADNRYCIGPLGLDDNVCSVFLRESANDLTPECFIQATGVAIDFPRVMRYHNVDCWMH